MKETIFIAFLVFYAFVIWGAITLRKRYHKHHQENRQS
jgi:hypothetical protein